jgi:hypothetical protein
MAPNHRHSQRRTRCRFCDRPPADGQHRLPGRRGPICIECVQAGLYVASDGETRASGGGTELVVVRTMGAVCDFCGRREREPFLVFRRKLVRVQCRQLGSVICADCLDRGGDLLNEVLRH